MTERDGERDPLAIGREVLRREAEALGEVAERLGASFAEAVRALEECRGRVIVTGVGKSGLVGAKIAATLTSTGTSAFFLHPTEALHGDLGIVTPQDVALFLSKSGRSPELLRLLPHLRRVGTVIVAVVASRDCPLGEQADLTVETGPVREACTLDLVPTTSSAVLMAVGDALAVALLRRRGLTAEDFAFVHPGGLIGRQVSRRVRELMHAGEALPRVPDTASLREALVEIVEKGLGVTTVVDGEGTLSGLLTDGDLKRILLRAGSGDVLEEPVARFMTRSPRTVEPEALVAQAVRLMETPAPGRITSLVVVEGRRPVGILHLHDCLAVTEAEGGGGTS